MQVLIVVDMQRDFVDGALGTREAQEIVPHVAERVKEAARRGERILFTRDTHEENYLDTQEGRKLPVPHCLREPRGGRSSSRCKGRPRGGRFWTSPPLPARSWGSC